MIHRELLVGGHFIGGECDQATPKQLVRAPFDGRIVGTAAEGGWEELRGCIDFAHEAFALWRKTPRHVRQALLRRVSALVRERSGELSSLLALEIGKPITWSRAEVARLALTFDYAADLLTGYGLEALPVDMDSRGEGYRCTVERFPIGVIFGVAPYNWPFNLVAHKVAPAFATGNTIVLKTSPLAPLSTLTLARLIHEAGAPPGVVNCWNGPDIHVANALADERVRMLSFTGSDRVGWMLKEKVAGRKVLLELGGEAAAIVEPDANLDWAVKRIAGGGYGYAGQVCISVQHVLVSGSIYDGFKDMLISATQSCPTGDPELEETVCGPLISESAANKVKAMVDEAVEKGGTLLAGGTVEGTLMQPTLIENVPDSAALAHQEVFGPVLTLRKYDQIDEAIQIVNKSNYGIQTGLFTNDLRTVDRVYRDLETGGLIVNDYPTLRFDNFPYGGIKRSGFGREGVRYAMDEMTEPKTLVVKATGI